MNDPAPIRADKWLWHARFFRTRALAAQAVQSGIRVNGLRVTKPAQMLRPGDVLTFAQGAQIRVVRVLAPGVRRGPAPEAQRLYADIPPAGGPFAADALPQS